MQIAYYAVFFESETVLDKTVDPSSCKSRGNLLFSNVHMFPYVQIDD